MKRALRFLSFVLPCCLSLWAGGTVRAAVSPARASVLRDIPASAYRSLGAPEMFNAAMAAAHDRQRPDSAVMMLEALALRASDRLAPDDEKAVGDGMNLLGGIYLFMFQDYANATAWYLKALDYTRSRGLDSLAQQTALNLANLQYEEWFLSDSQARPDSVMAQYRRIVDEAVTAGYPATAAIAAVNCGMTALQAGVPQEAEPIMRKVLALKGLAPFERWMSLSITAFGDGDTHRALALLDSAISSVDQRNPTIAEIYALNINSLRAEYLSRTGRTAELRALASEMIEASEHLQQPIVRYGIYRLLRDADKAAGDSAGAMRNELMMYRTRLSSGDSDVGARISYGRSLHAIDNYKSELIAGDVRQREYAKRLWLAIGSIAVFVVLSAVLAFKLVQLHRSKLRLVGRDRELLRIAQRQPEPAEAAPAEDPLWESICRIMENDPDIFDPDFSAMQLARKVGSRQAAVAKSIQVHTGDNLSALLARHRVREAMRRMHDTGTYGAWSVQGIAQSVGYKSRSHFSTVFKRETGMSPTDYMHLARKSD